MPLIVADNWPFTGQFNIDKRPSVPPLFMGGVAAHFRATLSPRYKDVTPPTPAHALDIETRRVGERREILDFMDRSPPIGR